MKIPVAIALLFLIFAAGFAGCDKLAPGEEDLVDHRNDTTGG